MSIRSVIILSAIGATVAGSAFAGGYTTPTVAAPIIAPVEQEVLSWHGAYAGVGIGYSFGADDEVGLQGFEGGEPFFSANELGQVDISGVTGALHAGYRWQRDRWVYGPELGIEFGSVDADDDLAIPGQAVTAKSKMNNIMSLRFKTGYLMNDRTMIFGSVGAVRGDFEYTLTDGTESITQDYSPTGYSLGLGVERKMTERMSLTAKWEYRNFGKENVDFHFEGEPEGDFLRTRATPEHHNLKIGLNFQF